MISVLIGVAALAAGLAGIALLIVLDLWAESTPRR